MSNGQDKVGISAVADDEVLARYVLFHRWVRDNNTIRSDAFIPYFDLNKHPHPDLSVTRHTGISEERIWEIGEDVASQRGLPLHGRADISAATVRLEHLTPKAAPTATNPNHVNIEDWPLGKAEQKSRAQKLAAGALYIPKPTQVLGGNAQP